MANKKLKDWFDKELAGMLAEKILPLKPDFEAKPFIHAVDEQVGSLALKDRVEVIADQLFLRLGQDYQAGISLLIDILGPENELETGMFTEFYWVMPIAKYVEKYGVDEVDISLAAIAEITKRNTGEYTIRPYLEQHTERTLSQMLSWSTDQNRHVRRLASEGVRPRLPWAKKLDIFIEDPTPILPILHNLKDDPSKYVQKSVANCINDILKDNFSVGQQLIEEWREEGMGKERKWIIKHALRNLLKADHPWAKEMVA